MPARTADSLSDPRHHFSVDITKPSISRQVGEAVTHLGKKDDDNLP